MWCKSCCLQAKRSQTPMVQTPLHPNFATQTVLASFECFGSQKMLAPGAIMWKSFTRILPQPDTRFPTCNCFSIWLQKPQVLTPKHCNFSCICFVRTARAFNPKYDLKNQHLQHCTLQAPFCTRRQQSKMSVHVAVLSLISCLTHTPWERNRQWNLDSWSKQFLR